MVEDSVYENTKGHGIIRIHSVKVVPDDTEVKGTDETPKVPKEEDVVPNVHKLEEPSKESEENEVREKLGKPSPNDVLLA